MIPTAPTGNIEARLWSHSAQESTRLLKQQIVGMHCSFSLREHLAPSFMYSVFLAAFLYLTSPNQFREKLFAGSYYPQCHPCSCPELRNTPDHGRAKSALFPGPEHLCQKTPSKGQKEGETGTSNREYLFWNSIQESSTKVTTYPIWQQAKE